MLPYVAPRFPEDPGSRKKQEPKPHTDDLSSRPPSIESIADPWEYSSDASWRWELGQEAADQRARAVEHSGTLAVQDMLD